MVFRTFGVYVVCSCGGGAVSFFLGGGTGLRGLAEYDNRKAVQHIAKRFHDATISDLMSARSYL